MWTTDGPSLYQMNILLLFSGHCVQKQILIHYVNSRTTLNRRGFMALFGNLMLECFLSGCSNTQRCGGMACKLNRHAKKGNLTFYLLVQLLHEQGLMVDFNVRLVSDNKIRRCQRKTPQ